MAVVRLQAAADIARGAATVDLAQEQQSAMNTGHIRTEIEQTRPLSLIMTEKVARLRAWAQDRTVSAD